MHQIHDKGHKKLFSNRVIFRRLLETFVNVSWVKDLDFDACEYLDKSFVSDHYKETASDIIHKVKPKDRELFVVILVEFKSTDERFTSLNISSYVHDFYRNYTASNNNLRLLPPIFPVLLYNGNSKWTAPTDLGELIQGCEILGEYAPRFKYFKIAIILVAGHFVIVIASVFSRSNPLRILRLLRQKDASQRLTFLPATSITNTHAKIC